MTTVIVNLLIFFTVTESDSPFEDSFCDIASYKQIEIPEFYNMNENSINDFAKSCNRSEVKSYYRKCDPEFAHPYTVNSDDLQSLAVHDSNI